MSLLRPRWRHLPAAFLWFFTRLHGLESHRSRPYRNSHGGGHRFDTCPTFTEWAYSRALPAGQRRCQALCACWQCTAVRPLREGRAADRQQWRSEHRRQPWTPNWSSFTANPRGLFLWETFVTGAAKTATHIGDAMVAAEAFPEALLRDALNGDEQARDRGDDSGPPRPQPGIARSAGHQLRVAHARSCPPNGRWLPVLHSGQHAWC